MGFTADSDPNEFPLVFSAAGLEARIWQDVELRRTYGGSLEAWERLRNDPDQLKRHFGDLYSTDSPAYHVFEWFVAADFTWERLCPPPPPGLPGGRDYWTREFLHKVLPAELSYLRERRLATGSRRPHPDPTQAKSVEDVAAVGLAFSGGGIRSATFHLGVLQALHRRGVLGHVDYLSTVSGGGYIGATLACLLRERRVGIDSDDSTQSLIDGVVEHLRRHGHYLAPRGAGSHAHMAASLMGSFFTHLLALFPFPMFAAAALALSAPWWPMEVQRFNTNGWPTGAFELLLGTSATLSASVLLLVVGWRPALARLTARWGPLRAGAVLLTSLIVGLSLQPLVLVLFHAWDPAWGRLGSTLAMVGTAGLMLAVLGYVVFRLAPRLQRVALGLGAAVGAVLPYLVFLMCAEVSVFGVAELPAETGLRFLLVSSVALWLWGTLRIDVNEASPHSFYRDRLAQAYLVRPSDGAIQPDLRVKLSQLCPTGSIAPYTLINSALNLQGRRLRHSVLAAAPREQRAHLIARMFGLAATRDTPPPAHSCDHFVFSPRFVGSDRTGYCRTEMLEDVLPTLDVATAVAVSGAAASPNMGTYTLRAVVPLMVYLNARLGFWLPNPLHLVTQGYLSWMDGSADYPDPGDGIRLGYADEGIPQHIPRPVLFLINVGRALRYAWRHTYWRPGPFQLLKEAMCRLDDDGRILNLSDGGHIENLGMMELLRRRCRVILAGDAGADGERTLADLQRLIEVAQEDLQIRIEVDLTPFGGERASQPFVVGRIVYPPVYQGQPEEEGWLLYLKSCLSGGESPAVVRYASGSPAFPAESTADQFFDQAQFEAYRGLGEHVADRALRGLSHPTYDELLSFLQRGFASSNVRS